MTPGIVRRTGSATPLTASAGERWKSHACGMGSVRDTSPQKGCCTAGNAPAPCAFVSKHVSRCHSRMCRVDGHICQVLSFLPLFVKRAKLLPKKPTQREMRFPASNHPIWWGYSLEKFSSEKSTVPRGPRGVIRLVGESVMRTRALSFRTLFGVIAKCAAPHVRIGPFSAP